MFFLDKERVPGQVVMPVMANAQIKPDSAAVFAAAFSLWEACNRRAKLIPDLNLSEAYSGYDQLMREVMRIGELFEKWACDYVDFDQNEEVWPYMLGDRFGETCLQIRDATELGSFGEKHCLRVAVKLSLPLLLDKSLPLPIDLIFQNPNPGSEFKLFRIQTLRRSACGDEISAFTADDNPFDPRFESPFLGIYGIGGEGELEHIADRPTYGEAVSLLEKLIPEINLTPSR